MQDKLTRLKYLRDTVLSLNDDLNADWRQYPCIEWPYARNKANYGHMSVGPKNGVSVIALATRVAHELVLGPIPEGFGVLHKCDNPPCFRPSHLWAGSQADNMRDCRSKRRNIHGSSQHMAILADDKVLDVFSRFMNGQTQRQIAAFYGMNYVAIWGVLNRKTWKHVPAPDFVFYLGKVAKPRPEPIFKNSHLSLGVQSKISVCGNAELPSSLISTTPLDRDEIVSSAVCECIACLKFARRFIRNKAFT